MGKVFDELGWASDAGVGKLLRKHEEVASSLSGCMAGEEGLRQDVGFAVTDERLLVVGKVKKALVDCVDIAHVLDLWIIRREQALLVATDKRVLGFCFEASDGPERLAAAIQAQLPVETSTARTLRGHPLASKMHNTAFHALHTFGSRARIAPGTEGGREQRPPGGGVVPDQPVLLREQAAAAGVALMCVPGKGRGLVSTRRLAPGDAAWTEKPLVAWKSGGENAAADAAYRDVDVRPLLAFLQAADSPGQRGSEAADLSPAEVVRVFNEIAAVNGWEYTPEEAEKGCNRAVFLLGSFLNNSCDPNLFYCTTAGSEAACFRAVKAVEPGDELTVAYTFHLATGRRQDDNFVTRGFLCSCERCSGGDYGRQLPCHKAVEPADDAGGGEEEECGGYLVPVGDSKWSCYACGRAADGDQLKASKRENWLARFAEALSVAPAAGSPGVLAALLFSARELGGKHGATYSLAETFLCSFPKDYPENLRPDAILYLSCYVLNYALSASPAVNLFHTRPQVVQGLANAVEMLQAFPTMRATVGIISLARHLYPVFSVLQGADGKDTVGMRAIAHLADIDYDSMRGFCFEALGDELLETVAPRGVAMDYQMKLLKKLVVIKKACDAERDPTAVFT
ncbi:hypothetical protein DIPPA_23132 [Diplonema papillatum]|nr:hypothetical protein DIPPA_23132 [Diplonema papillatum]